MTSRQANVDNIIRKTKARLVAVVQGSVSDTIDMAQLSDDKGGKMRVETGFLRASGRISFTGMPSGPVRGEPDITYSFDESASMVGLIGLDVGDVIHFGWSANYARHREVHDGFLESALMKWQKIVDSNVKKVKARIK